MIYTVIICAGLILVYLGFLAYDAWLCHEYHSQAAYRNGVHDAIRAAEESVNCSTILQNYDKQHISKRLQGVYSKLTQDLGS